MSADSDRIFQAPVTTLAASGAVVLDARGCSALTVIAGSGATVTVSRVDSQAAAAHTTGTENSFTVAATTKTTIAIDWAFYRISSAAGTARVACV